MPRYFGAPEQEVMLQGLNVPRTAHRRRHRRQLELLQERDFEGARQRHRVAERNREVRAEIDATDFLLVLVGERRLDEAQQRQRVRERRIGSTRDHGDARNIHDTVVGVIRRLQRGRVSVMPVIRSFTSICQ